MPESLTSTKREIEVNESKDRVEFFLLFQSFMLQYLSYLIIKLKVLIRVSPKYRH